MVFVNSPTSFASAREVVESWSSGRRDLAAAADLASKIDCDDLTRFLSLFPSDDAMLDRVALLQEVARHRGEALSPHRVALLEAMSAVSAATARERVAAILPDCEPRSFERRLALAFSARLTRRVGRHQPARRHEHELVREATRSDDTFFRCLARIMRAEGLLRSGEPVETQGLIDRARTLLESSPGRDVLEPIVRFLEVALHARTEGAGDIWELIDLRHDIRLLAHYRLMAASSAAHILAERGQLASSLALRLEVMQTGHGMRTPAEAGVLLLEDLLGIGEKSMADRLMEELMESLTPREGARVLALKSVALADSSHQKEAGDALLEAIRLVENEEADGALKALLAFARARCHEAAGDQDAAYAIVSEFMRNAHRNDDLGRDGVRISALRMRLARRLKRPQFELSAAVRDCIQLAARARDTVRLRDAYFMVALVYSASPDTCEDAIVACREAERITASNLQVIDSDREILARIMPEDPVQATVLSSFVARMNDQTRQGLQDLFDLTETLVEQATRTRGLAAALESSQRRMTRVLETFPVVIWASEGIMQDFALKHIEGAVEELFGHSPQDLLDAPTSWLDEVDALDRELVLGALGHAQSRLTGHSVEFRIDRANAPSVWAEMRIMPVLGEHQRDGKLYGILTDVTRRRQLEEELRRSQKMTTVGQLAGAVSHELNNVFGSILGAVTLLSSSLPADHSSHDVLSIIEQASLRGTETSSRLRALSQSDETELALVDMVELTRETADMARNLVGSSISVDFVTTTEVAMIRGTPSSLTQALIDIIDNADEASAPGDTITLNVRQFGKKVEIAVTDTGVGMDRETAAKAVDPFFTKSPGRNRGLGLTMVYRTVMDIGGDFEIDSAPERGTQVRMRFPMEEAPTSVPAPVEQLPSTLPILSGRLLLLDDDPQLLAVSERIMNRAGFEVVTGRNGQEGLDLYFGEIESWAIIVTDFRMPRCDGLSVVRRIREKGENTPILVMTGYSDDEPREFLARHSRVGLIKKPFTARAFIAATQALLDPPDESHA